MTRDRVLFRTHEGHPELFHSFAQTFNALLKFRVIAKNFKADDTLDVTRRDSRPGSTLVSKKNIGNTHFMQSWREALSIELGLELTMRK